MQRSSVTLANGCSTIRLARARRHRAAVRIEREAGHQRAVAQHELARLVVGRGGKPQRAAAE